MRKLCYLFVVSGCCWPRRRPALAREYSEQEEAKLGKEGTAEIEKQFMVLTDAAQLKRLDAIVKVIARRSARCGHTVKIPDTRDVNALAARGFLYVTKRSSMPPNRMTNRRRCWPMKWRTTPTSTAAPSTAAPRR